MLALLAPRGALAAEPPRAAQCAPIVSGFWDRIDALCAQTRRPQPEAVGDPELRSYCDAKKPPAFAALGEGARARRLQDLSGLLGVDDSSLPAPEQTLASHAAAGLIDVAGAALLGKAIDTPAGALMMRQFVGAVCQSTRAQEWLRETCAPNSFASGVRSLTRALAADLSELPLRLTGASGQRDAPMSGAVEALVRNVGSAPDPYTLAESLAESVAGTTGLQPCAVFDASSPATNAPPVTRSPAETTIVVAGHLLLRVLQDGRDIGRPDEHYVLALAQVLRDDGRLGPDAVLSPAQRQRATALVHDVREMMAARTALEAAATSTAQATELLRLAAVMVSALGHDLSLVDARDEQLPPGIIGLARALADGDFSSALVAAYEIAGQRAVDEDVTKAVAVGTRMLNARSEEDARRALRELLLPSWLRGLILDASAGIPVVGVDQFTVDLGGTIGWETDRWGFWGNVQHLVDDSQLGNRDWTESKTAFAASAWLNFPGREAPAGWYLGADLALDQLFSDLTVFATGVVSDEVSQVVRGDLAIGFFSHVSESVLMRLRGEAGFHDEFYSQDVVASAAQGGVTSTDHQSLAGDYRARAMLTWRAVPGFLRFGVQARGAYYQLTRTTAIFTFDPSQPFSQQNQIVSTTRLAVGARAGVEFEALEIADVLRPGAFVDVGFTRSDDGTASLSQTVVTAGLGLRANLPE